MENVIAYLIARGISITAMESCTAGLLASAITDTEGASGIFKGSFVTYSNEAKVAAGVPAWVIDQYGVYSPQVAMAMARASQAAFAADLAIGVTGTTGNPDPANPEGVVGEVYYAIIMEEKTLERRLCLKTTGKSRRELKTEIVEEILRDLEEFLR